MKWWIKQPYYGICCIDWTQWGYKIWVKNRERTCTEWKSYFVWNGQHNIVPEIGLVMKLSFRHSSINVVLYRMDIMQWSKRKWQIEQNSRR